MSLIEIIAEAGVNHNGDENLAVQLIEKAAEAGADTVKFQTFKAKNLVTSKAKQAKYQQKNTGKSESQLAMLSRLELSYESQKKLVNCCKTLGINFLSSAFDFESLQFLTKELRLTTLKIPSGEITNAPLVLEHARTRSDLIVSTGMATLAEIEMILGVIAFGFIKPKETLPSLADFQKAYLSSQGQNILKEKVTLLHCTTEYPAPFAEVNLRAMDTMANAFGLPVGYSDHTEGITVPTAAAARGACIIEKHFTLDKSLEGPDHKASLNPHELTNMVQAIRIVESIMGTGVKGPQLSEIANKEIARKSLVAKKHIKKGSLFDSENLGILRPGDGLSPFRYWELLGTKAPCDLEEGELLK
ncbi:N-acetylneuraminic acid synthetase [Legionella adelaidensis]|uniref:N-acetylneuraminic acid synthetase n=1 Tax=Legionella adelaidensis TaxID=45056 RepID=A0A0W0R4X8_9GAMM|nr:N-acetylneuraminate synthase [Legionella adelaidensis]KTC66087.1 N-acetylneuraminic acid synthetase [Legionella adelaidensis]